MTRLLGADLDAVLFGGAVDAVFDGLDFVGVVLVGVVFVVDVAVGGADVLRGVDGVLFVGGVRVFNVAVFALALFGVDVFSLADFVCHGSVSPFAEHGCPQRSVRSHREIQHNLCPVVAGAFCVLFPEQVFQSGFGFL